MTRIYRYVLAYDLGMAPNPRRGLITLATCKPELRKTARIGDWVIGNFPAPKNEVVAWAGKIARSLPIEQYAAEYPARHDALYQLGADGRLHRIPGKHPWYHRDADQQHKDQKGFVLVFEKDRSWYFGGNGRVLPPELHQLAARGQGHRVNQRQLGDLAALEAWLADQAPPGIHGEPRQGWDGPDGNGCGKRPPRGPKKPKGSC
jgi:hypothetical protein